MLLPYGISFFILVVHLWTRYKLRRKYNIDPNDDWIIDCYIPQIAVWGVVFVIWHVILQIIRNNANSCASETGLDDINSDDDR